MKVLITAFETHVLNNEEKCSHADRQTQDVYVREDPVLVQVPISDPKVVDKHHCEMVFRTLANTVPDDRWAVIRSNSMIDCSVAG
jgi:hypothetical protein